MQSSQVQLDFLQLLRTSWAGWGSSSSASSARRRGATTSWRCLPRSWLGTRWPSWSTATPKSSRPSWTSWKRAIPTPTATPREWPGSPWRSDSRWASPRKGSGPSTRRHSSTTWGKWRSPTPSWTSRGPSPPRSLRWWPPTWSWETSSWPASRSWALPGPRCGGTTSAWTAPAIQTASEARRSPSRRGSWRSPTSTTLSRRPAPTGPRSARMTRWPISTRRPHCATIPASSPPSRQLWRGEEEPSGAPRRVPLGPTHALRRRLHRPHRLDFQREPDLLADEQGPELEHLVPREPPVLPAQLPRGGRRSPAEAPWVRDRLRHVGLEGHRPRGAPNGKVPVDPVLPLSEGLDLRAAERDGRVPLHVEEVGRPGVGVPLRLPRVDACGLDGGLEGPELAALRGLDGARHLLEPALDGRDAHVPDGEFHGRVAGIDGPRHNRFPSSSTCFSQEGAALREVTCLRQVNIMGLTSYCQAPCLLIG